MVQVVEGAVDLTGKYNTETEFEDYNDTSQVYDNSRVNVGVDKIIALTKPTDHILEAGCGTCNYLFAISKHVNKCTGFELNDGMISRARSKAKAKGLDNVTLVQGSLLEKLPFEDGTFDGCTINQVLHHLDTDFETFPNVKQVFEMVFPAIKEGGFLVVNATAREQMPDGCWWMHLIPEATEQYKKHLIPMDLMERYMKEAGFKTVEIVKETEPLQGGRYYNVSAPLSEEFRKGDSVWSMVTEEKLEEVKSTVTSKLKAATMGAYFDKADSKRQQVGQTNFIIARK